MNISQWSVGRIMQLPDCVFGRRWPIIFSARLTVAAGRYYISEMALPDVCVLWELYFDSSPLSTGVLPPLSPVSIYLGDQLPTTDGEMAVMEPLFPEADELIAGLRSFRRSGHLSQLRKPIMAQGRRVVLRLQGGTVVPIDVFVGLVFSSMPKEVPDWLISGPVRNQL